MMSNYQNQWEEPPSLTKTLGSIGTVVGAMTALFGFLSSIFPGLSAPILTLLAGLVVSAVLVSAKFWTLQTAIITWLATSIVVIITFLIISQPATVSGQVIDNQEVPVAGLRLILTNSTGVDQRVVTDQNGYFEFRDVPDGRYTITVETTGMLLSTNNVSSGWQRIFTPKENVGGLIYTSSGVVATSTPVALAVTNTVIDKVPTSVNTPSVSRTARPTNTLSPTPNSLFDPTEEGLLLYEDFEDGVADGFMFFTPVWDIVTDESGNNVLQIDGTSADTWPRVTLNWDMVDFRIEYSMKPIYYVESDSLSGIGFLEFRAAPNIGYVFNFTPYWREACFQYVHSGEWELLSCREPAHDFRIGNWYNVEIEVEGTTFSASVNGEQFARANDSRLSRGVTAFVISSNTVMQLDNIRMWSLDSSE